MAEHGLAAGARREIPTFARSLTTVGRELIPAAGPVLAVANHPGVIDALSLMLALEARHDLKVVALDRPFLRALPGVAARLIWWTSTVRQEPCERPGNTCDTVAPC